MNSRDRLIKRSNRAAAPTADVVEVLRCKDCKFFCREKLYKRNPEREELTPIRGGWKYTIYVV